MSTPNPVPPTAVTPQQAVNNQLISQLLNMQNSLQSEIDYLGNAAANLADRQAKLAAVQSQLTALGYVAPTGS
jgi:septal ring factor EnvC (AmiA/AmiB activator)